MARVKIKWDIGGFQDVRQRADVKAAVKDIADSIAAECGDGFVAASGDGRTRARASVIAVTPAAMKKNRKENTILRAVASRGKS